MNSVLTANIKSENNQFVSKDFIISQECDFDELVTEAQRMANNNKFNYFIQFHRSSDSQIGYYGPEGASLSKVIFYPDPFILTLRVMGFDI